MMDEHKYREKYSLYCDGMDMDSFKSVGHSTCFPSIHPAVIIMHTGVEMVCYTLVHSFNSIC